MEHLGYRPAADEDAAYLFYLEEVGMRRPAEALWGRWIPSATIETYDVADHWIIEVEGRPVGCLAMTSEPGTIFIRRLYIAPDRRGRGIGTAVLREVALWAESATSSIRLSVLSTNPAARRLYEREGFVPETMTADRIHLILRPRAE